MSGAGRIGEPAPHLGGPWLQVETHGELEPGLVEWLTTNGAGAYAMSTVPLMHTRRHHGMLVAALDPPLDRHVILSHMEARVETAFGKTLVISTHQFPEMAPTPGYRLLSSFHMDPLPRWVFRLGKLPLERRLALVRGRNAVVVSYTWFGRWPAKLILKPLLALRPIHQVVREHGAMVQRLTLRPGFVEMQPVPHLPPVRFRHPGLFVGSPSWWRRFEYDDDPQRGERSLEDLWSPGTFEIVLRPQEPAWLMVALGDVPIEPPEALYEAARAHALAQDPGPERSMLVRRLHVAAEHFVAAECARPSLITGYPFYDVRTRDTLIALVGVLLARWRLEPAKIILRGQLGELHAGLLPERLAEQRSAPVPRSADATLWLFEAARELAARTTSPDPFLLEELFPALRRAFIRIRSGSTPGVWLTREGLLANNHPDAAMTWMAARAHGRLVTPRRGLAVELQALWWRACRTLRALAEEVGDDALAELTADAAGALADSFKRRFWCEATHYPFDVVPVDPADSADPRVRPNAVLALAVAPDLFERWQAEAIVQRARQELLVPRGLRSLSPFHREYLGVHVGPPEERESSYHQGTAWVWLLGPYARAALRLRPDDLDLRKELTALCEGLLRDTPVLGSLPQLADGDEPHRYRGCPAQAWSVGEVLRTLVCELGL